MFVVTDEVLDRLICCQCKKYLSVKPVKVYPNRGIKCGRCINPLDAGVTSLFGVLAEEALFRCVNRFDGCNKLLNYSDVTIHEFTCLGKRHECPICTEPFQGTGYEVLMHFKNVHDDRLLIGASEFTLNIDKEQYRCYLYQKNDFLFFVNSSYHRGSEELILSVSYLGTDREASKVSQMFSLLGIDEKVIYQTRKKPCSSVTGQTSQYFKISLAKYSFLKNVVICKFTLNVEDIENVLVLPARVGEKIRGFNFFMFDSHNKKGTRTELAGLIPAVIGKQINSDDLTVGQLKSVLKPLGNIETKQKLLDPVLSQPSGLFTGPSFDKKSTAANDQKIGITTTSKFQPAKASIPFGHKETLPQLDQKIGMTITSNSHLAKASIPFGLKNTEQKLLDPVLSQPSGLFTRPSFGKSSTAANDQKIGITTTSNSHPAKISTPFGHIEPLPQLLDPVFGQTPSLFTGLSFVKSSTAATMIPK